MNFIKKISMFIGFVVLAAAIVSALAPKATHALVATLVQVSNTPSSPVPNKDVDSPAHATVVPLNCFAQADQFSGGEACTLGVGGGSAFTVPAGQRLVVEQMSAFCQTSPNGSIPFVEFAVTEAGTQVTVPLVLTSNQNNELVTQAVRYYADPGSTISGSASGPNGAFCEYSAHGYLVTYP
jgi:hypothetical protein